ncbi:hypothetical protein C0Q70_16442 [Pomacea canaliculata]|uniref:Hexosyltransferase n=2 Tax=Pomacea canaliculata TaxID=400727 RepID=A0A2T7NPS9_POMCA|nr:hypothetical protein C0Q70_16442 [Pomacea canaliculata]
MWVNVPALLNLLQKEEKNLQTAVGGNCRSQAEPIRHASSKWYASFKSYPQPLYPGYCSGTAYTSSLNVARSVVRVSPDVPFFHLEDVYVSLCIRELGGNFVLKPLPGFYHAHAEACVLRAPETVTVHEVSAKRLLDIWSAKCP